MAEAGDSAISLPHVLDAEIADTRRSLSKVERAVEDIFAAIERGQVLPRYRTEERQDQELKNLTDEKTRLQGILGTLTSQRSSVVTFWRALSRASDDDDCLALKDGTWFMGDYVRGNRIYIRSCYRELMDTIKAMVTSGTRRVVITGTPGIGKSCYALYWLWHLRRAGNTVVYQIGADFYRFSGELVQHADTIGAFKNAGGLWHPDVWFLCDPARDHEPYGGCLGVTLVFVSPSTERYKAFLKEPRATTRYMPVWSQEEVQRCRQLLFDHVPQSRVQDLLEQWGGVPRFVLQFADDDTQQAKLQQAIRKCATAGLRATILNAGEDAGSTAALSDKVLHMCTADFVHVRLMWASQYAFDALCEAQGEASKGELRAFIASSARLPSLATLRGLVFEPYVHRLLGNGSCFEYRVLEPAQHGVTTFNFAFRRSVTFARLRDIWRIEEGVYYAPRASNLSAGDSFAIIDGVLFIFQITVAAEHGVKKAGTLDIVEAACGMSIGARPEFVLAFVVPPDRFLEYRAQNFVTKENKKAKLEVACTQWAIRLPVDVMV
ncbi:hypothetical protein JKP88DRAFT_310586 [Tribonema minus]|uniref:Uncharacterized protein n=1 Tax=Tribonema minus TaxID=303371 RepID=A0A835Z6Q5_9STRA|nr:hypothetical protein JKP88DRAFT_310586 [Tribonema minus]